MKTLSNGLGIEPAVIKKLIQAEAGVSGKIGRPLGVKTTPDIERVKPDDLERIYIRNPVVFNGINKIVQTIISAGYELKCSNARTKKWYQDFLNNIGNTGSDITWDELLTQIFKHQVIYGNGWVETIFAKHGKERIVDLDMIDPKKMDFAKRSDGKYALDIYGRPIGYVETLPWGARSDNSELIGDPKPAKVSLGANQIFLSPKRIGHFKLFTVGDGFKGIGLIEPLYKQTLWKLNIEKALANSIYNNGFPMRVISVGDANHEPTPEEIQGVLNKVKDLAYHQNIAIPYYHKISLLESKSAEAMKDHLQYFNEQEIASMGVPKPFVTGGGEETNRATLTNQERMFRQTIRDIIRRTSSSIKKYIFARIAKYENKYPIPEIVWHDVEESAEVDRARLLLEAVEKGVLQPAEVKDEILKIKWYGNEDKNG